MHYNLLTELLISLGSIAFIVIIVGLTISMFHFISNLIKYRAKQLLQITFIVCIICAIYSVYDDITMKRAETLTNDMLNKNLYVSKKCINYLKSDFNNIHIKEFQKCLRLQDL